MKRLMLALMLAGSAHARIKETASKCDQRYGTHLSTSTETAYGHKITTRMYLSMPFMVSCQFLDDSPYAARIIFSKISTDETGTVDTAKFEKLSDAEIDTLKQKNSRNGIFAQYTPDMQQTLTGKVDLSHLLWINTDDELTASYNVHEHVLKISTFRFSEAFEHVDNDPLSNF